MGLPNKEDPKLTDVGLVEIVSHEVVSPVAQVKVLDQLVMNKAKSAEDVGNAEVVDVPVDYDGTFS